MVLKMLPAEEADMYRSAVIEHEAYAPLETNQILFPGPFPTNILEIRAEQLKEQVQEPNVFCFKVIDTELEGEQMISFARWCVPPDRPCAAFHYLTGDIGMGRNYVLIILRRVVYDDTYPPKPKPRRGSPPGANAEAFDLLFDSLRELSDRSIGGRNIVYLETLFTDPKHQGRGAASMLISWGTEEAARRGLPAYLESSEAGHNLYLKHQFRDMEEMVLDFSKWGAEKPHRTWAMIKPEGGVSG